MTTIAKPRVLCVDDEPMVRRAMRAILERAGFEPVIVAGGREAIEAIEANTGEPFAMAFVDMQMPEMTGVETIRRLAALDVNLQFAIVTGSDTAAESLHEELGRSDVLVLKKPSENIEIVQTAYALAAKRELAIQVREHVESISASVNNQRLEAVGQLAAGVAHEINSPIQYVGDNIEFIRSAMIDMLAFVDSVRVAAMRSKDPDFVSNVAMLATACDVGYIRAELPPALESIQHGISRVTSIVRAMQELAYHGPRELADSDVNRSIENALQLTASTYRYLAGVTRELGKLPLVRAQVAELGQVFVNLIVNAAHAMEGKKGTGKLAIRSRVDADFIVVEISDNGPGIPDTVKAKIFDPFFTTKEVGRGTGQGLAISRAIVERHGGSLTFETRLGVGTTFFVRLPVAGPVVSRTSSRSVPVAACAQHRKSERIAVGRVETRG